MSAFCCLFCCRKDLGRQLIFGINRSYAPPRWSSILRKHLESIFRCSRTIGGHWFQYTISSAPRCGTFYQQNSLKYHSDLFCVLGVVLSQVDGDLAELGLVDAVGGRRHVEVVQQHAAALVARYPNVHLKSIIVIKEKYT